MATTIQKRQVALALWQQTPVLVLVTVGQHLSWYSGSLLVTTLVASSPTVTDDHMNFCLQLCFKSSKLLVFIRICF